MKKSLSLFVVISLLIGIISMNVQAQALNRIGRTVLQVGGDTLVLSNDALEDAVRITATEARYIAELFVQDMKVLGGSEWDDNTEVVEVVSMYDQTDTDTETAYTVELTEGYVVVSAYLDADSLIPEWSYQADPLYNTFNIAQGDQVIYLGAYDYYLDNGGAEAVALGGDLVQKSSLVNHIDETRDITNIPDAVLESCAVNPGIQTYETWPIVDPYEHANLNYDGPFVCNDFVNQWENYVEYYTTTWGSSQGWDNHCGPTAITNLIRAYENRYPARRDIPIANEVFTAVARYGVDNGYFNSTNGTYNNTADSYVLGALHLYDIPVGVYGGYQTTYENVKNYLSSGSLLHLMLNDNVPYGDHSVMCFAYTRLRSTLTGFYKTYLKIADGWNCDARFIDLATADTFSESQFVRVDLWG